MSGWSGWADENGKVGKSKPRGRRILPLLRPAKPAQTGKKNHVVLPSSIRAERKKEIRMEGEGDETYKKGRKSYLALIRSVRHSSFFFLSTRGKEKKEKKRKKTILPAPSLKSWFQNEVS